MAEQQRVFVKEFFANYRGDQSAVVGSGQVFGPNWAGERFVAIAADYDPVADKTRVQFETVRVMDARERAAAEVAS